jgi:MFS family permease
MVRGLAFAGAVVVSLDSMVNIAFPAIAAAFEVEPERMRWVIICYVFTYALMAFAGGAVADRAGHGRVFRAGVALSAVAFGLGGAAPTLGWFLAARVLQGLACGLVYGTAPGLVTLATRVEAWGRALGLLNGAIGLALALGPLAAGILVEAAGWRAVFHVRVPLAAAVLAWALVRPPPASGAPAPRLVAAAEVLRGPVVHAGLLAFLGNAGIFSIWLLAPFYLVTVRGLSESAGGVFFMLTPLGTAVAAPAAGWVSDRVGPWPPVVAGLALEAAGLGALALMDAATPLPAVAGALFAAGLGLGLFQAPNMTRVMAAFPGTHQGAAGGFLFLSRTLGTAAGVAVLAQVFAWRRAAAGLEPAFAEAFLLAGALVAAGVALAAARR